MTRNTVYAEIAAATFADMVRLVAALKRFDDGRSQADVPPLTPSQVEALRQQETFRKPLTRYILSCSLLPLAKLSRHQITMLPGRPEGRLAIFLLTEPPERFERAARLVGGAAMHRHVLATVLRDEREHLRAAFGDEAYRVATLEAPVLYPSLAAHASDRVLAAILGHEPDQARAMLSELGFRLLAAVVARHWPPLARLALTRWPSATSDLRPKRLPATHARLILLLLRRRLPAW